MMFNFVYSLLRFFQPLTAVIVSNTSPLAFRIRQSSNPLPEWIETRLKEDTFSTSSTSMSILIWVLPAVGSSRELKTNEPDRFCVIAELDVPTHRKGSLATLRRWDALKPCSCVWINVKQQDENSSTRCWHSFLVTFFFSVLWQCDISWIAVSNLYQFLCLVVRVLSSESKVPGFKSKKFHFYVKSSSDTNL